MTMIMSLTIRLLRLKEAGRLSGRERDRDGAGGGDASRWVDASSSTSRGKRGTCKRERDGRSKVSRSSKRPKRKEFGSRLAHVGSRSYKMKD